MPERKLTKYPHPETDLHSTSRGTKRVHKPRMPMVASPERARLIDGWWERDFLGDDGVVYIRRRLNGHAKKVEQWFAVTSIEVKYEQDLSPEERTEWDEYFAALPPETPFEKRYRAAVRTSQVVQEVLTDAVEEVKFWIAAENLEPEFRERLRKILRRLGDARSFAIGLRPPEKPGTFTPAEMPPTTVQ